jgi:hypothetical protein
MLTGQIGGLPLNADVEFARPRAIWAHCKNRNLSLFTETETWTFNRQGSVNV